MTKCECCEMREATHWMEWGEWLCDDCMDQALAEDSPEQADKPWLSKK